MYQVLYDFCSIPAEGASEYVAFACIALTCVFVALLVDFLARILSRFLPRWNRNI